MPRHLAQLLVLGAHAFGRGGRYKTLTIRPTIASLPLLRTWAARGGRIRQQASFVILAKFQSPTVPLGAPITVPQARLVEELPFML